MRATCPLCRFNCEIEHGTQTLLSDFDFVRLIHLNTELKEEKRQLELRVLDMQAQNDMQMNYIQANLTNASKQSPKKKGKVHRFLCCHYIKFC